MTDFRKYDFYETIPEVRERMAELASKRLCKDVKAIYFFDMLGKQICIYYVHRVRINLHKKRILTCTCPFQTTTSFMLIGKMEPVQ